MPERPPTYGLIGWPLAHSLSPALLQAAFDSAGLPGNYVLRPTEPGRLEDAVDALRSGELAGANVTIPHKIAIRALLDEESPLVAAIGAVNTVVRDPEGRLRGENTDVAGFQYVLRQLGLESTHGRAVVLGAGGAARAVTYALVEEGFAVQVLARSVSQASVLVGQLVRARRDARLGSGPLRDDTILRAVETAELLVNATPIGSAQQPDLSPWPEPWPVPPHLTVVDCVAWPTETRLIRQARASGARAEGGVPMLVAQAAEAFRLWTGRTVALDVLEAQIPRQ